MPLTSIYFSLAPVLIILISTLFRKGVSFFQKGRFRIHESSYGKQIETYWDRNPENQWKYIS